jgi:hypothetical protein
MGVKCSECAQSSRDPVFEDTNSDCPCYINPDSFIKGINRRENVGQSTFLARMEGWSFEEELRMFDDKSFVVFGEFF